MKKTQPLAIGSWSSRHLNWWLNYSMLKAQEIEVTFINSFIQTNALSAFYFCGTSLEHRRPGLVVLRKSSKRR